MNASAVLFSFHSFFLRWTVISRNRVKDSFSIALIRASHGLAIQLNTNHVCVYYIIIIVDTHLWLFQWRAWGPFRSVFTFSLTIASLHGGAVLFAVISRISAIEQYTHEWNDTSWSVMNIFLFQMTHRHSTRTNGNTAYQQPVRERRIKSHIWIIYSSLKVLCPSKPSPWFQSWNATVEWPYNNFHSRKQDHLS